MLSLTDCNMRPEGHASPKTRESSHHTLKLWEWRSVRGAPTPASPLLNTEAHHSCWVSAVGLTLFHVCLSAAPTWSRDTHENSHRQHSLHNPAALCCCCCVVGLEEEVLQIRIHTWRRWWRTCQWPGDDTFHWEEPWQRDVHRITEVCVRACVRAVSTPMRPLLWCCEFYRT